MKDEIIWLATFFLFLPLVPSFILLWDCLRIRIKTAYASMHKRIKGHAL